MFVTLEDINERKRLIKSPESSKKRTCIVICVISMTLTIGVAISFVGLSQNDTSNKDRLYTKAQMTIFNYSAKREICYSCPNGCASNDYHYKCSCYAAPWSSSVDFNYTAVVPNSKELKTYFGEFIIDCGNTKAFAIDNAKSNPSYKVGDIITGWYLNSDPSIYVLQDPALSLYWVGFLVFSIIALVLAVAVVIILYDRCKR